MSRQITSHKINAVNDKLRVESHGGPGTGGACSRYSITPEGGDMSPVAIPFQNKPLSETGGVPNGITVEALLAICQDRLEGWQDGPYRCRENAIALTKIQEALHWLQHRTLDRMRRGVEGTWKQ